MSAASPHHSYLSIIDDNDNDEPTTSVTRTATKLEQVAPTSSTGTVLSCDAPAFLPRQHFHQPSQDSPAATHPAPLPPTTNPTPKVNSRKRNNAAAGNSRRGRGSGSGSGSGLYPRAHLQDEITTRAAPFLTVEIINHQGEYQPFCLVPLRSLTQNQSHIAKAVRQATKDVKEGMPINAERAQTEHQAEVTTASSQHHHRHPQQQQHPQSVPVPHDHHHHHHHHLQQHQHQLLQEQHQLAPTQTYYIPALPQPVQQQPQIFHHHLHHLQQPASVVVVNGQHYVIHTGLDGQQQLIPVATTPTTASTSATTVSSYASAAAPPLQQQVMCHHDHHQLHLPSPATSTTLASSSYY